MADVSPIRIARTLNDFIGHVHAARCSQAIWIRVHDDSRYQFAAKYGLQAAFGVIALTLRKFEDFYDHDLARVIPDKSKRPAEAKWLFQESKRRHLRDAANTLIAHYTDDKRQIPSASDVEKLIRLGGWSTEEDLMAWCAPVIKKLEAVRDAVMAYHGIKGLDER
jgi:hypothetical protein